MHNMTWKLLLIIVVTAGCGWSLASQKIALGKDLQGGVSLIYGVDIPEGTDSSDVLTRMIDVLKDRVNPTGVLDISMEPLGNDRIEIVMPLPSEEVRQLQDEYQEILESIVSKARIRESELDEALRQGAAVDRLAGGDPLSDRGLLLARAQEAWDDLQAARTAYEEARTSDADRPTINRLAQAVADAQFTFDDLRSSVLARSLDEARVIRMLRLDTKPIAEQDEAGLPVTDEQGNVVYGDSPRERVIGELKAEFPTVAEEIDALVAAFDEYDARRTGLDDPADLKRMLKGAGVLDYRIAVRPTATEEVGDVQQLRRELEELGPNNTTNPKARWFEIHDLEQWYETPQQLQILQGNPEAYFAGRGLIGAERDGVYYLLLYTTPKNSMVHEDDGSWSLKRAYRTTDQLGRTAVGFELDSAGGSRMGRLTGANVGQPMAILLDGRVYSAPTLQSVIQNQGQITGEFSSEDINYLIRVLSAGELPARLSPDPIAQSTVGPSLGRDNLLRGMEAFIIAIIAVAVLMISYYFFAGVVSVVALALNGIIIFGFMNFIHGQFTLPGLAGIVLTIGMAVDANVLIYERIREELFEDDSDLRGAIRQGYAKALSTIIDANITNLIVCFVLFRTATTEVKGFAMTLTIGICATLFTALFVTRQVYYLYTELYGGRKLSMLPTAFPAIHRALEPSIDWMRLRPIFWTASFVAVTLSIVLVWSRGVDMLDTELRGGITATMATAPVDPDDPDGERLLLVQAEVSERIREDITNSEEQLNLPSFTSEQVDLIRAEFPNASVLTVGELRTDDEGRTAANRFQVKIPTPKEIDDQVDIAPVVVALIEREFGEQLDITPGLEFAGMRDDNASGYATRIREPNIGAQVGIGELSISLPEYVGGSAFVLRNVSPPTTTEDVQSRLEQMRTQPDFVDTAGRVTRVLGFDTAGQRGSRSTYNGFVVLTYDDAMDHRTRDDRVYYERLETREWELIRAALGRTQSLEQVSTFSSAVANTLKARAGVAVVLSLLGILVYIWFRFGSLRYSLAAIVALAHDVTISLGLLALSGVIGGTGIASMFLIEEFRIDLGVVAALLTIIGYSLNDTIVILDRIRENRGKRPVANTAIVNRSINQCVSRTVLTSLTTLVAVLIMYFEGGSGIRPFTFCLLAGLLVGTYSSVAIASPLVVKGSGSGRQAGQSQTEPTVEPGGTSDPAVA